MMKKNIFCICILLAGSHASFSQISFYVKPTLDTKSFISSTYGSLGTTVFSFSDDVAENPYFKVDNVMMFHHDNYQIGLYLGANFGDGKHLLEVGWNQDATGSMMRTSEMTYNKPAFPEDNPPVARYFDNGSSFASALFTQRFTIQHSFRINKNSEKNTRLYFITEQDSFIILRALVGEGEMCRADLQLYLNRLAIVLQGAGLILIQLLPCRCKDTLYGLFTD